MQPGRVVLALGGNAITPAGTAGTAEEQTANIAASMRQVADLVAEGFEVVLTHGNGPQVGNLLVKNELARDVVPPMPLDWCVAQTQATIGFTIADTLSWELGRRGLDRPVVPVVSRVRVAADDPAFEQPTKPIGRWITDPEQVRRARAGGHVYQRRGERGWRRIVASPEPLESVDLPAVRLLLDDGALVVANGGGGIPVVRPASGPLEGVAAVIDKDLAGALLAAELDAGGFVTLTDVAGAAVGYGTDAQRWLGETSVTALRELADDGQFAAGSMGPKVEAVCRFAERTGRYAAIGSLADAVAVCHGTAGTRIPGAVREQSA